MSAPEGMREGQSSARPPYFNGQHYSWWKKSMKIHIHAEDYQLWQIVEDDPLTLEPVDKDGKKVMKSKLEYTTDDVKKLKKNAKAMRLLLCALGPDEYNRISGKFTAKEIWDTLKTAYEGTNQVNQSKVDILVRQFELFSMHDDESIQSMYTRFTSIVNELKSLDKIFSTEELVRKILRCILDPWMPKITAIQEAKDLQTLPLEELIGNLMTFELMLNSRTKEASKRDKSLALKTNAAAVEESSESDDEELALMTRKFRKFFKQARGK
ncbi:hypothetical protein Dimus_039157 [Dionaea muscipula]